MTAVTNFWAYLHNAAPHALPAAKPNGAGTGDHQLESATRQSCLYAVIELSLPIIPVIRLHLDLAVQADRSHHAALRVR